MPTVTATQTMTRAFRALNVFQPGDPIPAADSTDALDFLNMMIGQWAQQGETIPQVSRLVFPLIANKGSSTNPYTIGTGGDLNTPRPPNQNSILAAGLLLNASTPPVEIPRGLMTNDAWELERIKDLSSTLYTNVYYRPDFNGDLGSLFTWPVPSDLTNSMVLYARVPLSTFADLTTSYSVPPGYDQALYTQFALIAAIPWGRSVPPELRTLADSSFALIKRSNLQISDLPNDFGYLGSRGRRGTYNIQTGEN